MRKLIIINNGKGVARPLPLILITLATRWIFLYDCKKYIVVEKRFKEEPEGDQL